MYLRQGLTRRDGLLVLIGATVVYVFTSVFNVAGPLPHLNLAQDSYAEQQTHQSTPAVNRVQPVNEPLVPPARQEPIDLGFSKIPETTIIAHAPGWTMYRNLYMSNGTLYLVSSNHENAGFPPIRMMTSTGLIAENNPENIRLREPTDQEMKVISLAEAGARWGGDSSRNERHRILTVEGRTVSEHSVEDISLLTPGSCWSMSHGNSSTTTTTLSQSFSSVHGPSCTAPSILQQDLFRRLTASIRWTP